MDDRSKGKAQGADFTEASDPFAPVSCLDGRGRGGRAGRSRGHGARHRRCRRSPQCADDSPEGRRRPRLRLLYQLRERQGPRAGRQSPRRRCCSTGRAWGARSPARPDRAGDARPRPTPISPRAIARAASAPAPRASRGRSPAARRSKRKSSASTKDLRRRPGAAPVLLARLSAHPARDRVLAERRLPPARPHRVPPRFAATALDQDPPLSVTERPASCGLPDHKPAMREM